MVPACVRCGKRAENCCRFESHSGRTGWSGDGRPGGSNGSLQQSGWSCRSQRGRPSDEREGPVAPERRLAPRGKRHTWWTGWPLGWWRWWSLPGLWNAQHWSTQRQNRWLGHWANTAPPVRTHQSVAAGYPGNWALQDPSLKPGQVCRQAGRQLNSNHYITAGECTDRKLRLFYHS